MAFEPLVRADLAIPITLCSLEGGIKHVMHQRGLAGAADAGHAGQRVERDLDIHALEVVLGRAEQPDGLRGALAARWRYRDAQSPPKVLGRRRPWLVDEAFARSG